MFAASVSVLGAVMVPPAVAGGLSARALPGPSTGLPLVNLVAGAPEAMQIVAGSDKADATGEMRCFITPLSLALLTETYTLYENPMPVAASNDPACFEAAQLSADLHSGAAVAFLSQFNVAPGFDRVVAVYADGRAYVWRQSNETGK